MISHQPREMWIAEAGRMVRCLCACGFRAFVEGYPSEDLLERHMAEAARYEAECAAGERFE